jgi:enoyl-CoA hydratase
MTADSLVNYQLDDGIAILTMDDSKANVMSAAMLAALNAALDRAASDSTFALPSSC